MRGRRSLDARVLGILALCGVALCAFAAVRASRLSEPRSLGSGPTAFGLEKWVEVEPYFRALLDNVSATSGDISVFSESLDPTQWLREVLGVREAVDADLLQQLARTAEPHDRKLQQLRTRFRELLHEALTRQWARGKYNRYYSLAPLDPTVPESSGPTLCTVCWVEGPWMVTIQLLEQDHPSIAALREEMERIQGRRDEAMRLAYGESILSPRGRGPNSTAPPR